MSMKSTQGVGGMRKRPSIPETLNGGIVIIKREYYLWVKEPMLSLLQQEVWSSRKYRFDVLFRQLVM